MKDRVRHAFLERQLEEGLALARESDLLDVLPLGQPADRFVAQFRCRGLVQITPGTIVEADRFEVAIWFPSDYLRVAHPFEVLTWLGPRNVFHPNISSTVPAICIGRLAPGTGLVDILYQAFEVITWQKATVREDDALNADACQWARHNTARYPVDRRPLKRRAIEVQVSDAQAQVPEGSVESANGHT